MKTLYLVGNGFDIQHGIRTPYSEFRSFLETHHESFLSKWIIYYYSEDDKKRLKDVFGILGLSRKFETYFLPSRMFWDD